MKNKDKRKWCYTQPPRAFEIAPCSCGNEDTQWSEFSGHLWCNKCLKDFIPAHNGIFDGPIGLGAAKLCGITFDRINLETNQLEKLEDYMQKTEPGLLR